MKAPFHLRRRPDAAPAAALLLPSHRAEDLLRLLERHGGDPLPQVYPVADGFLLKLPRPADAAAPGTVRLRALANDLLLPADADLVPPLLDDEAAALVRRRGLVFLPGGRVLEYAPDRPLSLAALLALPALKRPAWGPLPEPPPLPDALSEITLDLPQGPPEAVLEAGGTDIGTEAPLPPESDAPARPGQAAAFGLGKGLAWLGQTFGLQGLSRAGARLMAGAMSRAPWLSAGLLGRQEAALRELLRLFREGAIERALRRAIALGGSDRGAGPYGGSGLPWRSARYSLGDLLGPDEPGAVWFGNFDVMRELEQEYRRQAERAARAGDYRRAAFIYGMLLHDFRAAAVVLAQGGLHRDAALLYEKKLHDLLAAAREYEAAGDVDRALALYRQRGQHALAGDLLRRAGEEELAVAEYRLAARKVVEANPLGHHEAGELLLARAGRADLALPYFEEGWRLRPNGPCVPCALRLAQLHAQAGDAGRLGGLVGEAEGYFGPPGNDTAAAEFYHEVARLADRPELAGARDDLRDRALLGVAVKLRQQAATRARPGPLVQTLTGPRSPWAPAMVSDARFAVDRAARRRTAPSPLPPAALTTVLAARVRRVTAVCRAPETGAIFLGFESGEVYLFRPRRGEVVLVADDRAPVQSLATDFQGKVVVVLSRRRESEVVLSSFSAQVGFRMVCSQVIPTLGEPWLCPLLAPVGQEVVGLWDGADVRFLRSPSLVPAGRLWGSEVSTEDEDPPSPAIDSAPEAGLVHPLPAQGTIPGRVLLFHRQFVQYLGGRESPLCLPRPVLLGWGPGLPADSTLSHPSLSWLLRGPQGMELAGVDRSGVLGWSQLTLRDDAVAEATSASRPGPYRAVALVQPGLLAAVTPAEVQWLRREGRGFRLLGATKVALPGAVACYAHPPGNEVIVVCGDGTVARVARSS